ncbi:hypothetical protein [Rubrivirga marina]|uniref:Outer membrane protein beta-barrel domain-containing protein n=1 Tax=Rubrivirga marina TaxID=1196024 RepID=A0A271IZQ9_9BACT|nr:hypothetical protein [Rubrivirga marina]PAP76195.1 hypothetical protein BSZ37_06925 [Rubrivirga marina]
MRLRPLALLLLAASASAQPSGLYLTGAFSRTQFDGDRLALLGETYSDVFSTVLDAPVDFLPGEHTHPALGAAVRIGGGGLGAGFAYQVGRATSDEASAFSNGRGNRVQARTLDHVVTIDLTGQLGPLVVGGSFGGMFRGVRVEVATTYPDGSESLGSEFVFNGVYTASSTYFEVGVLGGLAVGDRVFVPVRLLFPVETFGEDRLPATDFDASRNGKTYLPRDFGRYLADPNGLDDGAAVSDRDYVGLRLQVGVELRLF